MNSSLHYPPSDIEHVYYWYRKSTVDYTGYYLWLYICYSAWYQRAVGTTNDREAIGSLKKRFVLWGEYTNGQAMGSMRIYMKRLAELTQREPLITDSIHWRGVVEGPDDWRSLIEFWYQVRCLIVHGATVNQRYVWLAYQTLDVYMNEIINRMQKCFTDEDMSKLISLSKGSSSNPREGPGVDFVKLRRKLEYKYVNSPDIWQVDMDRSF